MSLESSVQSTKKGATFSKQHFDYDELFKKIKT